MKILVTSNKNSRRVSLVPNDVNKLVANNIEVYLTSNTTKLCGFSDDDYIKAGAHVVNKLTVDFIKSIDIVSFIDFPDDKVITNNLTPRQILWGFMFLVNNPEKLFIALKNGLTTIAVEAINDNDVYEYFLPMEQIKAGCVLELANKAIASYKIPKKKQPKGENNKITNNNELKNNMLILNYSYSGYYTAKNALDNKYNVMYLEKDNTLANELRADRDLRSLITKNGCHFNVIDASYNNLIDQIKDTNILVTTNQLPTTKSSIRITKDMIDSMPQGSVFINLDAETGFASNSEKKPTIIDKPWIIDNNISYISIENMCDMFPIDTSSIISKLNTKNFMALASDADFHKMLTTNNKFKHAIMTYEHCLTNKEIASSLHLKYTFIDIIKKI